MADIDLESKKLKKNESYLKEYLKLNQTTKKKRNFTNNFELVNKCDCIIICVPTPLKNKPDLSLYNTIKKIYKYLKIKQLIILENTSIQEQQENW